MPDTFAYPLSEFYSHAKLPLPRIEQVAADALPEPHRALLAHSNDMTSTLEAFHKSAIHIELLRRERRGDFYFREVVLRLDSDDKPVEFGAIKIFISRFPDDAQDMILREEVPLGRILKDCKVAHRAEAKTFLRIESDAVMAEHLALASPATL